MKYLVSATPAGFISFVSRGYGGRVTDRNIVIDSGFLSVAPVSSKVLADRGFKNLGNHGIDFIVPPSKNRNRTFTKAEVLKTRQIASLRIQIERVIERLREFHLLKDRVNSSILKVLDQVVVVASALTNIESKLTKV